MKTKIVWQLAFFGSMMIGILAIVASGGGGGGGSSGGGGGASGVSYTGITSRATITSDNVQELAGNAFIGQDTGIALGRLNVSSAADVGAASRISMVRILRVMEDVSQHVDDGRFGGRIVPAATESGYFNGTCGGRATFTINVDEFSGYFEGQMTFEYYCDLGIEMDGQVGFSGTYDVVAEEIETFNFTFDSVNITCGPESIVMHGSMSIDADASTVTVTMDCFMQDDTGQVFWVNDYQILITEWGNRAEVYFSGRFYHPGHGYVELVTTETFIIYSNDHYPSSGTFVLIGDDGTQAELTAVDDSLCQLRADLDGNGHYDWSTGDISWDDMVEAEIAPATTRLEWYDGQQTLISYQYSRGVLSGLNFYRKFSVSGGSGNIRISATLRQDSSSGALIDSHEGTFYVIQGQMYTVKVHAVVGGRGLCSPFDTDVMVFSSPSAASDRNTFIYPTIDQNQWYCIRNYSIDTIGLE